MHNRVLMGVDNGLAQIGIRFDGISFELALKEISGAVVAQVEVLSISVEKVGEVFGGVGGFVLKFVDTVRSFGS